MSSILKKYLLALFLPAFIVLKADIEPSPEYRYKTKTTPPTTFRFKDTKLENTLYYYDEWKGKRKAFYIRPDIRYYEESYQLYSRQNGSEIKLTPIINSGAKEGQQAEVLIEKVEGTSITFSVRLSGEADKGTTYWLPIFISGTALLIFVAWLVFERKKKASLRFA